MPATKKTRKKTASSANKGRKGTSPKTRTIAKKRAAKPGTTTSRSKAKSKKTEAAAVPATVVEPRDSSRARKIVASATKVALTTQSRARRWVRKAGEYLSKPGRPVRQAIAMATESYRKRSKSKKENT